jgi:hypothetical protein
MITDERLKQRAITAINLQSQGAFLIDQRRELPFLSNCVINELRYSRDRDEQGRYYNYETSWGKFNNISGDFNLLILRKGRPPDHLLPQPELELATCVVHAGYITINNNGSSFDLDFQTRDQVDYSTLSHINQTLASEELPIVVWKVEQADGEIPQIIRIANDSAMVFASSAIWSPDDQQLVATQVVTTSQELLKAIKASLAANNSKGIITVKAPNDSAYLKSARRGFINSSNSLTQANAEGNVTVLLHPLSGDPQTNTDDYLYIVATAEEDVATKLAERLDLAIPWPIQPEWAEYLLEAGKRTHLVEVLPSAGDDFTAGLRVIRNESLWQDVISKGLKGGQITID